MRTWSFWTLTLLQLLRLAYSKKEFPERHIDCGIAECNMMGIAAGLATTGKVPFASTFAMFAAGRAFEQVRNSIAYPKINVKIGATHGGISVVKMVLPISVVRILLL